MKALGALVPLLAVAAFIAAGCGSSTLSLDPVASAATKTTGQGGAFEMTVNMGAGSKSDSFSATGTFDGTGNYTMDMNLGGSTIDAVVVQQSGDAMMYMKSPVFSSLLPSGKTWAELDLTTLLQKAGLGSNTLGQGMNDDPTAVLTMLGNASDGVTKVGDGTVVGVHATQYHANVDLAKAAKEEGVSGAEAQQLEKLLAGTTVPVDVWVDDSGYVRELDEHLDLTITGHEVKGDIVMKITDVGPQPAIQAPAASDAYDITDKIPSK